MFTRDVTASVNIAAGAEVEVLNFDVPGIPMEITGLGFGLGSVAQWASVVFSLRVDGRQVPDYGAITDEIGTIREPRAVSIQIPARCRVSIVCKNGDANPGLFAATIKAKGDRV